MSITTGSLQFRYMQQMTHFSCMVLLKIMFIIIKGRIDVRFMRFYRLLCLLIVLNFMPIHAECDSIIPDLEIDNGETAEIDYQSTYMAFSCFNQILYMQSDCLYDILPEIERIIGMIDSRYVKETVCLIDGLTANSYTLEIQYTLGDNVAFTIRSFPVKMDITVPYSDDAKILIEEHSIHIDDIKSELEQVFLKSMQVTFPSPWVITNRLGEREELTIYFENPNTQHDTCYNDLHIKVYDLTDDYFETDK